MIQEQGVHRQKYLSPPQEIAPERAVGVDQSGRGGRSIRGIWRSVASRSSRISQE